MIKDLIVQRPREGIVLIAFLMTLFMTLVTKFATNQNRMKDLKKRMNEIKDLRKKFNIDMKANLNNQKEFDKIKKKIEEFDSENLKHTMEMMSHSFKPLLFTFLPIIILFGWIKGVFSETLIADNWFWWYFVSGIISSIFLRKALDVA